MFVLFSSMILPLSISPCLPFFYPIPPVFLALLSFVVRKFAYIVFFLYFCTQIR